MEKEIIKEVIAIEAININPTIFDESFLLDSNFIDNSKMIDRSFFHISNMGSHIQLKDDSATNIDITLPHIKVKSNDKERLNQFFEILKNKINLKVNSISYNIAHHYYSDNILEKVTSSFYSNKNSKIDYIRFSQEDMFLSLYECREGRLHVSLEREIAFDEILQLNESDFNLRPFIDDATSFLDKFLTEELKINEL